MYVNAITIATNRGTLSWNEEKLKKVNVLTRKDCFCFRMYYVCHFPSTSIRRVVAFTKRQTGESLFQLPHNVAVYG